MYVRYRLGLAGKRREAREMGIIGIMGGRESLKESQCSQKQTQHSATGTEMETQTPTHNQNYVSTPPFVSYSFRIRIVFVKYIIRIVFVLLESWKGKILVDNIINMLISSRLV
jgi:hypothetical protein